MTWSYQTSGIANSSLMKVRLMIGDTDANRQQLQDEEINWVLGNETSPTLAAAACADLLAGKYSFLVNTENLSLKLSAASRQLHYQTLADRLRKGGAGEIPGDAIITSAEMYVGGQSVSAKADLNADSDNRETDFSLGMDDSPWTSTTAASGVF